MAMIRVKLKRTIFTQYEPDSKCGKSKGEKSTIKRVVRYSRVISVESSKNSCGNDRFIDSGVTTKILTANTAKALKDARDQRSVRFGQNKPKTTKYCTNDNNNNTSYDEKVKGDKEKSSLNSKNLSRSLDSLSIKWQPNKIKCTSNHEKTDDQIRKSVKLISKEGDNQRNNSERGCVGIKPAMTPSGKKVHIIKPNKATCIPPRKGEKGPCPETKKENITQKQFNGQEVLEKSEEYLKLHPELTKALTTLFEHLIQQLCRSQLNSNTHSSNNPNDQKMIKCEPEKSAPVSNGLTKIEEHDEFENNDQCNQDDQTACLSQDIVDGEDITENDTEVSKLDDCTNDFDPLKYAIEFFANYNSDTNQFCVKPVISSQG